MKILKFKKYNEGLLAFGMGVATVLLFRFILAILKRNNALKSMINGIKSIINGEDDSDVTIQEYEDVYYIAAQKKSNPDIKIRVRVLKEKRKINITIISPEILGGKDADFIITKSEHQALIKILKSKV